MSNVHEVTDVTFEEEVLQASEPVLVDFWATWCRPCLMIGSLIEELANENSGSIKVVKVDIDESRDVAAGYGVSSIPTLMVFKDGNVVERFVGMQSKNRLQQAIDEAAG